MTKPDPPTELLAAVLGGAMVEKLTERELLALRNALAQGAERVLVKDLGDGRLQFDIGGVMLIVNRPGLTQGEV